MRPAGIPGELNGGDVLPPAAPVWGNGGKSPSATSYFCEPESAEPSPEPQPFKRTIVVVQDAITMAGMVWHGMEIFTAGTQTVVEESLRHVREADVLVGIVAYRYGWEPDGDKSITEMEYDAAAERLMSIC